ncbi:MAG: DNA repair protein RecO [Parcubacteria group bacterium CG2_30_36_18]|uniref:DNA repair protein RecO n=1 Tax=Candidatus Nealsonbacteria bacterium CG_4_10_14_3_um_filter_36_16 TaxID=1974685 RepID=A0A2M7MFP4_9BACT|nr:MAG: DNA repair protein RecO [Parcubacteria group bacterium CG2_30_36_18]PIX88700.1 MAG: DNA repair protein RecO [Candidatus Nealsonbacteria bacterium CG_4_10_14_3_um_filter_36_16]
MFLNYWTKGFILKKEDRGEADQIFTIYTKDFGKLEILGKAIRKISSKLRSGAETFYLSEIEFIQGKTYKTLTDAILVEKFKNLRKDLKRLPIAYKISEILDNLVRGQEADEKIWYLLNETFNKLNNCQIVKLSNCQLLYYYFLWSLLSILGYKPELYNCSLCQKKLIPEKLYFNPKEGGIICQNCFKKLKSGKEVKPEIVKILRIMLEKNWITLSKLKIEKLYLKSLAEISKECYSYIRNNS